MEEFLGGGEFCFRKPRVFFSRVALPVDKVLPSGWSSLVTNDLFDFIMFFVIDEIWGWRWEVPAVDFIFVIRGQKRSVECVVNFPRLWESEFVGDRREYFCDGEWSLSLGSKLWVWERPLKVSSF